MISSSTTVRVRYAETDQMGVVYYANYFEWFEVGRCEAFRAAGFSYRALEAEGVMLPVIEATCQYHRPGRYDDEIEVTASGRLMSPARLSFDYELVRCQDRARLASGRTVHAAIGPAGKPCRLPRHLQELLS